MELVVAIAIMALVSSAATAATFQAVSYTHLTLPTILLV